MPTVDRERCFSFAGDGCLREWDVQTGKNVRTLRHGAIVFSADTSPDGKLLATCGGGVIRVWDAQTGDCVHTIAHWIEAKKNEDTGEDEPARRESLGYVRFSQDNKRLYSTGEKFSVHDVASWSRLQGLDASTGSIFAMGATQICTYSEKAVSIWDLP